MMAQNSKSMVEGKAPPEYAGQAIYSTFTPHQVLGLPTQRSLSRLSDYVHKIGVMKLVPVNQMGSCMFAAVRHLIDTPAEYTNTHLWQQLVKTFLAYKEFFYPVLKEHIRGNYGHLRLSKEQYEKKCADNTLTDGEREDYLTPGPFSFATYLHALLNPRFWGDEIC